MDTGRERRLPSQSRPTSRRAQVRERPDGSINRKPSDVHPPGAIQEFKPTFMAGVPKVWDILKKAMEDKVAEMSTVKRFVFQVAFCADSNHWSRGSPPNFRTLELGQIKVDSADLWANRWLSSSSRSTAKGSGPNRRVRAR